MRCSTWSLGFGVCLGFVVCGLQFQTLAANIQEILPFSPPNPNPNTLIQGRDSAFYGATANGGGGYGTVFRATTSGLFANIASFADTNGSTPQSALALGNDGAFYGTTLFGASD